LDIGCGEAGYIKKLAGRFSDTQFTGIEISEEVTEKAQQLTAEDDNIKIQNADLWDYNPEQPFDMVMMNNVLHYIDLEKREALIHELADWVNPGCILSIVTPIAGSSDDPPFANGFNSFFSSFDNLYRLPTRDEWRDWGEAAGLDMLGIHTVIKEGGWYIAQYKKPA